MTTTSSAAATKTLLVTPFAPYRDGIATYALQELRRMRANGDSVDVLSPLPSAARWHLRLGGPAGMVQLARKAAQYERTVIQFGPELLFGGCRTAGQRVAVWTALAALSRRTSLDVRIHEIEYDAIEQNPFERRAARLALDQADRVTVHTEAERARLNQLLGLGRRIEVVDHGRDFLPAVERSPQDARAELGISADDYTFVAIGFLQHHKGFDRAIEAMAMAELTGAHLHIVGSARVDHPDILGHVDDLQRRCALVPAATLHQRFVSDVEFDLWLQAADAVVLPYREIWSSGVLERARMFNTQVVAADLPQLRDQAPPGTVFATEPDELALAMEALAVSSGRASVTWSDDRAGGGPGQPGATPTGSDPGRRADDRTQGPTGAPDGWTVDVARPDRNEIQAQIVARARDAQIAGVGDRPHGRPERRPVDPLLALGDLHRPAPTSARPGVAPVKRLIERLVAWQIDPLASRLEALQRATVDAVAQLERPAETPLDRHATAGERSEPGRPLPGRPPMPDASAMLDLDLSDHRTADTGGAAR